MREEEPEHADQDDEISNALSAASASIVESAIAPAVIANGSAQLPPNAPNAIQHIANLPGRVAAAPSPFTPLIEIPLFRELPQEVRIEVWRNSRSDRVLSITRQRKLDAPTFTYLDVLKVKESEPVGTLAATYESRDVALSQYPLAFGTNTEYLGAAGARLRPNAFPARTRFSAAHDIVYLNDFANVGLEAMTRVIHIEDRNAIQRLAMAINATENVDIDGFVSQLHFYTSLRELILVVDLDAPNNRHPNRQGFVAITAPWDAAIQAYYDSNPEALRPTIRFEVPGWNSRSPEATSSEDRSRFLGAVALNYHASIRRHGRQDRRERGAILAVRERGWSL